MRRILDREKGALNGYIITVACLAFVIVGGVFLLKYLTNQNVDNDTNQQEVINIDIPDDNFDEDDDSQPIIDEPNPYPTPTPNPAPIPPDTISNAGPTENSIITLFLIVITGYMVWNYRLSRIAMKKAILSVK